MLPVRQPRFNTVNSSVGSEVQILKNGIRGNSEVNGSTFCEAPKVNELLQLEFAPVTRKLLPKTGTLEFDQNTWFDIVKEECFFRGSITLPQFASFGGARCTKIQCSVPRDNLRHCGVLGT